MYAYRLKWGEFIQRTVLAINHCSHNLVDGVEQETYILLSSMIGIELVIIYLTSLSMFNDCIPCPVRDPFKNLHFRIGKLDE